MKSLKLSKVVMTVNGQQAASGTACAESEWAGKPHNEYKVKAASMQISATPVVMHMRLNAVVAMCTTRHVNNSSHPQLLSSVSWRLLLVSTHHISVSNHRAGR